MKRPRRIGAATAIIAFIAIVSACTNGGGSNGLYGGAAPATAVPASAAPAAAPVSAAPAPASAAPPAPASGSGYGY